MNEYLDITGKSIEDIDYLVRKLGYSLEHLERYFNWYLVNNKIQYFKSVMDEKELINELLGVEIAKYLGSDTISYTVATDSGVIGLLSENFRSSEYKYISSDKLKCKYNKSIEGRFKQYKKLCKNNSNYKKFLKENKKLIVQDLYSSQTDRFSNNLYIKQDGINNINLAPLFDYSNTFDIVRRIYLSSLYIINLDDKSTIIYLRKDPYFRYLFDLMLELEIIDLLDKIRDEHKIEVNNVDEYIEYEDGMKDQIKELKLNKKIL